MAIEPRLHRLRQSTRNGRRSVSETGSHPSDGNHANLQLPLRGVLVDRAHNGFEPPCSAASCAMASLVESATSIRLSLPHPHSACRMPAPAEPDL
jgi:hypothetical protein